MKIRGVEKAGWKLLLTETTTGNPTKNDNTPLPHTSPFIHKEKKNPEIFISPPPPSKKKKKSQWLQSPIFLNEHLSGHATYQAPTKSHLMGKYIYIYIFFFPQNSRGKEHRWRSPRRPWKRTPVVRCTELISPQDATKTKFTGGGKKKR